METKTIAAISTALSPAGISVIRVSGDDAVSIAEKVFHSKKQLSDMRGYTCAFGAVYDENEKIDEAVATVFLSPHSYTGENVVELSCHGGVSVTKRTLEALLKNGAALAEPGEFTRRAFLNSKLDLAQAESVMDLIAAKSKSAARAALLVKEGALSKKINAEKDRLLTLLSHLSAWADYPEEDIPAVSENSIKETLSLSKAALSEILSGFDNGRILKDGVNTVIIGKPNVGKSTLMNLLSGWEKSIVTPIAGTTRDLVEETINLDGVMLNLCDTAGIRATSDEIEQVGVDRARRRLSSAQLLLCVFDASSPLSAEDEELLEEVGDIPAVAIVNKTDLPSQIALEKIRERFDDVVMMSSKTGDGYDALCRAVKARCLNADVSDNAVFLFNERQRRLTADANDAVEAAESALALGLDAVTVALEEAIGFLCELTGERVTDEVLDRVFHNFCVGK